MGAVFPPPLRFYGTGRLCQRRLSAPIALLLPCRQALSCLPAPPTLLLQFPAQRLPIQHLFRSLCPLPFLLVRPTPSQYSRARGGRPSPVTTDRQRVPTSLALWTSHWMPPAMC